MIINTATLKEDIFTITSKDKYFASTPLSEHDFTITLRSVGRTESINIFLDTAVGDDIDRGEAAKRLFIASIVSWTGFEDESGAPLPCNDEIKTAIWESSGYNDLVAGIQAAIREKQDRNTKINETIKKK